MSVSFEWRKKSYPSIEHCNYVLSELKRLTDRWENIKLLSLLLAERTPSDETDFTNPTATDDTPVRIA